MLWAYFDETGTHDQSEMVMIGGLVSAADDWQSLENDWQRLLSNLEIAYFHASECNAGDGIFASLPREFRYDLARNLAKIIASHVVGTVQANIFREDWMAQKDGLERHFSDPYHFCFESCMHRLSTWSKQHANGERVALVFALQNERPSRAYQLYSAYTMEPMWREQLGNLTFSRASECPALQAADLFAYEFFRYAIDKWKRPETKARDPMQILIDAEKTKKRRSAAPYTPELLAAIVQHLDAGREDLGPIPRSTLTRGGGFKGW
jgi:Protein of unknown function (DUF3800)